MRLKILQDLPLRQTDINKHVDDNRLLRAGGGSRENGDLKRVTATVSS